jgi:hypothetical protein
LVTESDAETKNKIMKTILQTLVVTAILSLALAQYPAIAADVAQRPNAVTSVAQPNGVAAMPAVMPANMPVANAQAAVATPVHFAPAPMLGAAGYSLIYLLFGGGLGGAVLIFIIAKMLGK